jgi:hypothetical protein
MHLIQKLTSDLRTALKQIDRQRAAIVLGLEALAPGSTPAANTARARKMTAAQRQAVSKRMKAYWRKRRAQAQ